MSRSLRAQIFFGLSGNQEGLGPADYDYRINFWEEFGDDFDLGEYIEEKLIEYHDLELPPYPSETRPEGDRGEAYREWKESDAYQAWQRGRQRVREAKEQFPLEFVCTGIIDSRGRDIMAEGLKVSGTGKGAGHYAEAIDLREHMAELDDEELTERFYEGMRILDLTPCPEPSWYLGAEYG